MKIISIIAVFFALCCGVLLFMYNLSEKENKSLQANLNTLRGNNAYLQQEIKKRNENAVALSERVRKLEEEAKTDTAFDWYVNIANSPVIKRLQAD
jgi:predicted nuclease with TOPRIM domain